MRGRTTLILALLLLGLGAFYYLYEVRGPGADRGPAKALTFQPEEVTAIEIERPDGTVRMERRKEPEGWTLTAPLTYPADQATIDALLRTLRDAVIERTLEAAEGTLGEFGLAKPAATVSLTRTGSGEPLRLAIGDRLPVGHTVYAQRPAAGEILIIPATVRTSAEQSLMALRDKEVARFNTAEVTGLRLTRVPLTATLQRDQETWRITAPKAVRADRSKVEALLQTLRGARVKRFLDDPPKDLKPLGLGPPTGTVEITTGQGEGARTLRLLLGRHDTAERGVYVRTGEDPRVLLVEESLISALPKALSDLRDRSVLHFDQGAVQGITLQNSHGTIRLARESGEWRLVEPLQALADQRIISDLLWDLSNTQATAFVRDNAPSLKPFGLHDPPVRIHLAGEANQPIATLALAPADTAKHAYAVAEKEGREGEKEQNNVMLVERTLFNALNRSPFELRFRHLVTFEVWQVEQLDLTLGNRRLSLRKKRGKWEVTAPQQREAKQNTVLDLLNRIHDLKWDKIAEDQASDLTPYGLETPEATVRIRQQAGERIGPLAIGKRDQDGVYARVGDGRTVYLIPADFLDALGREVAALTE
ncbi:MAG: DUF4340 domain-containing protein [Candidatus Methylomirabilales bacterium]